MKFLKLLLLRKGLMALIGTGILILSIPVSADELLSATQAIHKNEVVIIDKNVLDGGHIARNLDQKYATHILNGTAASIDQISRILGQYRSLSAIHLISHGSPGTIQLFDMPLDSVTIDHFSADIREWGNALSQQGDILLYGCRIASGKKGEKLLGALAKVSGADVAGSINDTGPDSSQADTILEARFGTIERTDPLLKNIAFKKLYTFDWDSLTWTTGSTGPNTFTDVDSSGADVTVNITGNTNGMLSGYPSFDTDASGEDELNIRINWASTSENITITYYFSQPAYISDLFVKDIDRSSNWRNHYQDIISVSGVSYPGGASISPSSIDLYSPTNLTTSPAVNPDTVTTTVTPGIDPDNTRGWAGFNFETTPVSQITITYDPGDGGGYGNPTQQWIWISDFTFDVLPTLAVINAFGAEASGTGVEVYWETSAELGTVGFYLERKDDKTGRFKRLNDELLLGLLTSPQGGTYRYLDPGAVAGETYTYRLVEMEARGQMRHYGPYTVTAGKDPANLPVTIIKKQAQEKIDRFALTEQGGRYGKKAKGLSAMKKERIKTRIAARKAALNERDNRRGRDWAKISLTEAGLYFVDAETIADILGISPKKARKRIKKGRLDLSNRGFSVAWQASETNDGLFFYGETIDSIYTATNVYNLKKGKGRLVVPVQDIGAQPVPEAQVFTASAHFEEDQFPITGLCDNPEEDFWTWQYILSGDPSLGTAQFTLPSPGAAPVGTVRLRVELKGGTNTDTSPDHHVRIGVNGQQVGETYFDGTDTNDLELTFDAGLLQDGDNTVTVSGVLDTGAPYSIVYVDGFDIEYPRYYEAVEDQLFFGANGDEVVTIKGFSSPDVLLWDITDPWSVMQVQGFSVEELGDGFAVSFHPSSASGQYLAAVPIMAKYPDAVTAAQGSGLKRLRNRANYLVITAADLQDAAQSLADYRQGNHGLIPLVVTMEQVYDTFNYGIENPLALKEFLSYAYTNWKVRPRYAVLAGEGSIDYRDVKGLLENVVPILLVSTPYGLFASDTQFGDVEGADGVPEIAVGRLPVMTAAELEGVLYKIFTNENSSGPWQQRVMLTADNPDDGGNFTLSSEAVAGFIPPDYTVDRIYLEEKNIEEARTLLLGGFDQGARLVNYFGHAGLDRLADEGLLTISDVNTLTNMHRSPIVAAMTCAAGRFALPGYDAIGETLVLSPTGGAVAFWGPTGASLNDQAQMLDEEFFEALFVQKETVLGDAVKQAMAGYANRGGFIDMLFIYTLIGDPAQNLQ